MRFAALPLCLATLLAPAAHADTYDFSFWFESIMMPSVVEPGSETPPPMMSEPDGSGELSFDEELGAGTYALADLTNLSIDFTFLDYRITFDETHMMPTFGSLLVSGTGNSRTAVFTGDGSSGCFGGAQDFVADGYCMATSNTGNEGLFVFGEQSEFDPPAMFGSYEGALVSVEAPGAAAVPLPAGLPLMLFGLAGLGLAARRRS